MTEQEIKVKLFDLIEEQSKYQQAYQQLEQQKTQLLNDLATVRKETSEAKTSEAE